MSTNIICPDGGVLECARASTTLGSGDNPVKASFHRARRPFRGARGREAAWMQGAVDGLSAVDGESVTFSWPTRESASERAISAAVDAGG